MHRSALRQIMGLDPLPAKVMDRIALLTYADANHIIGQMASAVSADKGSRLDEIFRNALLRAGHDHRMLQFEMNRLEHALKESGIIPLILKGGAYVALGKRAGKGRRVSDLDILVTESELEEVEAKLELAGWHVDETTDNPYDQAYYRDHMHELPPLRHKKRGTILDVHHRLLPKTARYCVDFKAMRQAAIRLGSRQLTTFDDVDLFIHSAVHAFGDGSFDTPARSLVELYMLYEELSPANKDRLGQRTVEVGAGIPVAIALWAVGWFFSVNSAGLEANKLMKYRRHLLLRWAIISKTLERPLSAVAKAFLYIRSHYLRMPLHLLIPHLVRKAFAWRPKSKQPIELPFP